MSNRSAVDRKIARIKESLDAIEAGRYHDLSIEYCNDYIAWLAKFHKVPRETWEPLCDRVINIFSMLREAQCWD